MTTDTHMISGDFSVQTDGMITMLALGTGITISAAASPPLGGSLFMNASAVVGVNCGATALSMVNDDPAQGAVSISAGNAGNIALLTGPAPAPSAVRLGPEIVKIRTGPKEAGCVIEMLPEMLSITVGEPGAGASIKITPESITFKVAEVTYTMTPEGITETVAEVVREVTAEGITEDVAEVTREMTPEGHNFTAAETEYNVGVEGFTAEGPLKTHETEGADTENTTIGAEATDAIETDAAGVAMDVP